MPAGTIAPDGAIVSEDEPSIDSREPWELFFSLGTECDLGRFAHLNAAQDRTEAEMLLNRVMRLDLLPTEALANALALGVALPDAFSA